MVIGARVGKPLRHVEVELRARRSLVRTPPSRRRSRTAPRRSARSRSPLERKTASSASSVKEAIRREDRLDADDKSQHLKTMKLLQADLFVVVDKKQSIGETDRETAALIVQNDEKLQAKLEIIQALALKTQQLLWRKTLERSSSLVSTKLSLKEIVGTSLKLSEQFDTLVKLACDGRNVFSKKAVKREKEEVEEHSLGLADVKLEEGDDNPETDPPLADWGGE